MTKPSQIAQRHNPRITKYLPNSPLTIGNGEFAFTMDPTGFQSFDDPSSVPLCTMAQWGFHSYPSNRTRKQGYDLLKTNKYQSGHRRVGYMDSDLGQEELFRELRISPHRANLIRIGLVTLKGSLSNKPNPKHIKPQDISQNIQELDLASGIVTSSYTLAGQPVKVQGFCLPHQDSLRFSLESPLIQGTEKSLGFLLAFPYPSHEIHGSDWTGTDRHKTQLYQGSHPSEWWIVRTIDDFRFAMRLTVSKSLTIQPLDDHRLVLSCIDNSQENFKGEGSGPELWQFGIDLVHDLPTIEQIESLYSCGVYGAVVGGGDPASGAETSLPPFDWAQDQEITQTYWDSFWNSSAWIDFSGCTNPRAQELERRVVLSRYLTAIQCSGSLPPAETGLTCNSWYGKFHLEMHFWHTSSFPLWGQPKLLARSLPYYRSIAQEAYQRARTQGYQGLRWPKMTDPQGLDSPSAIGVHLAWQQPHFLVLLELLAHSYGIDSSKTRELMETYQDLVFATADWMADYPVEKSLDIPDKTRSYHLGPPLIPVQENHPPAQVEDPVFELEYWRLGLDLACEWKHRLGQPVPESWYRVKTQLAKPPIDPTTGGYRSHRHCTDTYDQSAHDHPSFLMAWSYFAGETIDPQVMEKSLELVVTNWDFDSTWGWDFPVMAMTAARLGKPDLALDFLLMEADKNTWLPNGHNAQLPKDDLPFYLPGNGALLLAVAMMAGGWKGSQGKLPGFPKTPNWQVQAGGFVPVPW
jgi:hypothetical protein